MGNPFTGAAQTAIKAAGSVGATKSATLKRASASYNASTRKNTLDETDYTWSGVLTRYRDSMVDGETVKAGDRKFLGAAADISVTPDPETDKLVVGSLTYRIVDVFTDPADATHELQLRR